MQQIWPLTGFTLACRTRYGAVAALACSSLMSGSEAVWHPCQGETLKPRLPSDWTCCGILELGTCLNPGLQCGNLWGHRGHTGISTMLQWLGVMGCSCSSSAGADAGSNQAPVLARLRG